MVRIMAMIGHMQKNSILSATFFGLRVEVDSNHSPFVPNYRALQQIYGHAVCTIVSGLVAPSTSLHIIIISESYGVFCKKRVDFDDIL